MRKKRLIKKLMGIGVGRNDAAAFVKVRSRLKSTGQLGKLLPEMELADLPIPVLPQLRATTIRPQLLRAEHTVSRSECGSCRRKPLMNASAGS